MSDDDDIGGLHGDQVLVAEYVLGLLDAAQHAQVAARIAADPGLAEEVRLWQLRLSPLDRQFEEVAPPPRVLSALESRLFAPAAVAASPTASWWNSLAVWRSLAGAAAAVALVAVGFNVMRPSTLSPEVFATQLVAALNANEGSGVEFVALYDPGSGTVRLRGLSGNAVANQDYELWYINGDDPAVSMGVIPVDQPLSIELPEAARAKFGQGIVLAVTLEQKGGSPTGVAQGPIVSLGAAQPI